jgi:hypothetical protein
MAAWAFLPASLLMRGVAMARIADMIRTKRDVKIAAEAEAARVLLERLTPTAES